MNVEVKLRGVDDARLESGADPLGGLMVRGPPVGRLLVNEEDAAVAAGEGEKHAGTADEEPWADAGVVVKVQTNGVFTIVGERA